MSSPLILVVDDSPDLCELWCMLLEDAGFATHATTGGADALAALQAGLEPRIILLDYSMPGVDGPDVLAALGRDPRLASIPVVLASGVKFNAPPPGVARVLLKPFLPETLVDVIRACCAPVATDVPH